MAGLGEEAEVHGFALTLEDLFDAVIPLFGERGNAFVGEGLVGFGGGFVEAEFDDGEIRRRVLEILVETEAGDGHLGGGQFLKVFAEVDEHEVALVVEHGLGGGRLAIAERGGGLVEDGGLIGGGECAPGAPLDADHLVEDGGSFEGERDGGQLEAHLPMMPDRKSVGHASSLFTAKTAVIDITLQYDYCLKMEFFQDSYLQRG